MTTITCEESYSKGSLIYPNKNFQWEGHSDGNEGILKVITNGKDTKIIHFTKDQLEDLFNQSVMKIQLDKKLMMDFMSDNQNYINPFKSMKNDINSKNSTRKGKNIKKNNKSKKNK
jgi:hypothetical protein